MSKGLTISHMASHPPNARYPDASAVTYDEANWKVTVVYNDHSIYVWDVRDIKKVKCIYITVRPMKFDGHDQDITDLIAFFEEKNGAKISCAKKRRQRWAKLYCRSQIGDQSRYQVP